MACLTSAAQGGIDNEQKDGIDGETDESPRWCNCSRLERAKPVMTSHAGLAPEPWIVRFAHLVPHGARVLDVAAGEGRHARFFAERGARVVAVDRDEAALRTLQDVEGADIVITDLEHGAWPFEAQCFDAIVVVNYLHRALFPELLSALAEDGTLLYQTFARGNEQFGHPRRPAFLLEPDELLQVAAGPLCVVAYEQGYVTHAGREAVVQRIAAVGRSRRWPPLLVTRDE